MPEPVFTCTIPFESFAQAASGLNLWPEQPITWASEGGVGNVSAIDFRGIIPYGLKHISDACGAVFKYNANPKTAAMFFRAARPGEGGMGQPGQVLADAMLVPAGLRRNADFQSTLRFDPGEMWTSLDDMLNGKVPMEEVVWHEGTHAMGVGHSNDPNCIMYWQLRAGKKRFTQWSLDQLNSRYPASAPQPGAPPAAGDVWETKYQGGLLIVKRNGVLQRLSPSPFGG